MSLNKKSHGPLAGLNVLDCGTAIVGPWAASLLAFLGAQVLKLERPSGEITRLARPHQKGWSTAYSVANLSKMSAEIDFKKNENTIHIDKLLSQTDVVIENFRPGVAQRIGIGFDKAKSLNKNIVYASSSGWGDTGPMRDMSAVDSHLQAFSGFAALNGMPKDKSEILRYTHIDPSGSVFLAAGVLLGVLYQHRFGESNHLITSHLSMSLAMQATRIAESLTTNRPISRLGSACTASVPNQCFLTADNKYIAVTVQNDRQWLSFCDAIDDNALGVDDRFCNNLLRVENRVELIKIISKRIKSLPLRWWSIQFSRFNVPSSMLMDTDYLFTNSHIKDNDFIVDVETPHSGILKSGGLPWTFKNYPASIGYPTSHPGADTDEILNNGFGSRVHKKNKYNKKLKNKLPLSDLRILEFSNGYAGPYLGLLLAEVGAKVTKIELENGDWSRKLAPECDNNSAIFNAINRNKKIINFKKLDDDSLIALSNMIKETDVVIYDSGEIEDKKIKQLIKENTHSKLIALNLSYYGDKGELSKKTGSELSVQAITGYLRSLGSLDKEPVRVGADIAESAAASMGFLAILAAIYCRENTGNGDFIHVSRLGSLMSLRSLQWAAVNNPDKWLGPSYCLAETDTPRYGYKTKDKNIFVSMMNLRDESSFISILKDLGMLEDLKNNEKFMKEGKNTIGMGYLTRDYHHLWEKFFKNFTSNELLEIFNKHGATAVEFLELNELISHPQIKSLNLIDEYDGKYFLRSPWMGSWPKVGIFTNE